MQDLFKSKIFWITALIITGVVFLAGINLNNGYKAEVRILFVPKSELTGRNIARIILDAEEIFKLREKGAEIKTSRKSDIVKIITEGESRVETQALALKSARGIAIEMSRYYNIKNDLDMRIIDGPIAVSENKLFNIAFFLLSLFIGAVIGMILYFILKLKRPSKARLFPFRLPPSIPQSQAFPELSKKLENKIEEDLIKPVPEKKQPASVSKKAFAPENLPIGSDFVLSALHRAEEAVKHEKEIEAEKESKTHEATEEEIKRRLNMLLGKK